MIEKWGGYPEFVNHPIWTRPYYGVQHRKNTPRHIHISVCQYETGTLAYKINRDLKKNINESNFSIYDEHQWFSTPEEARAIAETW